MSMTKHDYDKISQAIADTWVDAESAEKIAQAIAETLEANNSNFDRVVFLSKAGVEL